MLNPQLYKVIPHKCKNAFTHLRYYVEMHLHFYTNTHQNLEKMKKKSDNPINGDLPSKVLLSKNKKDIREVEKEVKRIEHNSQQKKDGNRLVRTSVFIPEEELKKLKVFCIQNGIVMKEFLTQIIVEKIDTI